MSNVNPAAHHVNLIGPFETFRDYNAEVERCKKNPRRAECRHSVVEVKQDGRKVTRLAPYNREETF